MRVVFKCLTDADGIRGHAPRTARRDGPVLLTADPTAAASISANGFIAGIHGAVMVLILDAPVMGPGCRYTDSDVFLILEFLSDGRCAGRGVLMRHLDIGEGSVRGLLNLMRDLGLVKIERCGVSITGGGMSLLNELGMRSVGIDAGKYAVGRNQYGVVVGNVSEKVFNGIDQRNAGYRAGGDGCTTLVMRDGSLIMLPNWNIDENDPDAAFRIRDGTRMTDGDTLIFGGGETRRKAMLAACSAALDLVRRRILGTMATPSSSLTSLITENSGIPSSEAMARHPWPRS